MKHLLALLFTASLVFLTGCGGTANTPSAKSNFRVSAGTLTYSSGPGLSVMYAFELSEVPANNEIDVTIDGPDSWDSGQPVVTTAIFNSTGSKWSWHNVSGSDGQLLTLQAGEYVFTTTFEGKTYEKTVTIDPADALPSLTDLQAQTSTTGVTATWAAVEGTASYKVELFSGDGTLVRGQLRDYTEATTYTFSDLELASDTQYYVAVQAFPNDFTASFVPLPDVFKTSYKSTALELDTAASTQRLKTMPVPSKGQDQP